MFVSNDDGVDLFGIFARLRETLEGGGTAQTRVDKDACALGAQEGAIA